MAVTSDLEEAALATLLGDREIRAYPAVLSTEAMAMAWARQGAPSGSVVVADYQASPRGRGGLPWTMQPGIGLGFTMILRPNLEPEREGWPYVAALVALSDVVGVGGQLFWPDAVTGSGGTVAARLGTYVQLGPMRSEWVTVTALIADVIPPRGSLLASLLSALETRFSASADEVLADYLPRCATIGQRLRARLIPMGPGGPEVTGEAVDVLADGALVLRTARGNRVAVPPQHLGMLEQPEGPVAPPDRLIGQRPT